MEEESFELSLITKFTSLDISLMNHYKEIDNSLCAWVVMLDDKEFDQLKNEVTDALSDDPELCSILPLIIHFKGKLIPGSSITERSVDEAMHNLRTTVTLMSLCRKGLLSYKPGKTDDEWQFFKTKAGDDFNKLVLDEDVAKRR